MRVLLVADDRMIAGITVTQALRDPSYAVDWVLDGELGEKPSSTIWGCLILARRDQVASTRYAGSARATNSCRAP